MTNPEYTDEVVAEHVLKNHELEQKAIEIAWFEMDLDDDDDLQLRDIWVDEVERGDDEWTVVLSAVLCYTTQA